MKLENVKYNKMYLCIAHFGELANKIPGEYLQCRGGCLKSLKKPVSGYSSLESHIVTIHADTYIDTYAKLISSPQRRSMDPSTLESILILKVNRDLWDQYVVQAAINKSNTKPVVVDLAEVEPTYSDGEGSVEGDDN